MDKINGNYLNQQTPDFPLDCETLQYLSDNTKLCELLGNIAGDKVIIKGCTLNQEETERTDGYVFIRTDDYPDGEILPFEGGAVANGFDLIKTDINVSAGSLTYPKAYTKRSLVAGNSHAENVQHFTWDEFVELTTTKKLKEDLAELDNRMDAIVNEPFGIVKIWAGTALPPHYKYCNGEALRIPQNEGDAYRELYQAIGTTFNRPGTRSDYFCLPDLSGRFIVGRGYGVDRDFGFGDSGGESSVRLTDSQIPAHTHKFVSDTNAVNATDAGISVVTAQAGNCSAEGSGAGSVYNTSSAGGGESHNNLPPYYVLAYIIRYE